MEAKEAHSCRNCGAPVSGAYCSACGQKDVRTARSLSAFASEAVGEFFSFESKLLRTAYTLLFLPGTLTKAYWNGQRQLYSSPFRVYIFASVIAFLALSLSNIAPFYVEITTEPPLEQSMSAEELAAAAARDDIGLQFDLFFFIRVPSNDDPVTKAYLEILDREITNAGEPGFRRNLVTSLRWSLEAPQGFAEQINLWLSRLLILFVGIIALLMMPLFPRRYVVEHVIFAVHLQAFTLVGLSLLVLFSMLVGTSEGITFGIFAAINMAYVFMAIQRAYGNRWWVTGLKFVVFSLFYVLTLVIGSATVMLAAGWSMSRAAGLM